MQDEKKISKQSSKKISRRSMLKGAGLAAGAAAMTVGFPAVRPSVAQPQFVLKVQSGWSPKDIFHEVAEDLIKKINEMSGGRLKIDLLPDKAVVPAFELLEAVGRGILDGAHAAPSYWFGKHHAAGQFTTGANFGLDAEGMLAWTKYGGGQELYDELLQKILKFNVVSFLHGPCATQPLGWFPKEIKTPDDLKGVRFRTVGVSAMLFGEMGAAVKMIASGEIIPAMERGVLDAAEFNNTTSDKILGFPDVRKICMTKSYHQPCEFLELLVNKTKYDSLPKDLQAVIKYATMAESSDMTWKFHNRNSADMIELEQKRGVKFIPTPKSVLKAQLDAWDKIIEKESKADPFYAKVVKSQREFAERVVYWKEKIMVEQGDAYEHYFKKKIG
jgi:TRAP-type mannitol/chloroaromatic compound transport system substrate-binding protein